MQKYHIANTRQECGDVKETKINGDKIHLFRASLWQDIGKSLILSEVRMNFRAPDVHKHSSINIMNTE